MILRLRLSDFLFAGLFLSVLLSGTRMLSIDSDLGRHLTIGNYILDYRIVPTHDLFSHTLLNHPRPPYEWLSQVIFALAYRLLNLDGVILFTILIISAAFVLTFQFASDRSKSPIIAFAITLVAVAASSIHWLPRPHIITFLFLAIWVQNLERLRRGEKAKLVAFPLLMLLWANLHGGFIFGFLAWAAHFAGWVWDKWRNKANNQIGKNLFTAGTLALVVSVITPDFWHNWEAVLNNRSAFILSRTAETMPSDFSDPSIFPFIILVVLVILFSLANQWEIPARHVFLLSGLGLISVLMARNIALFAIACAPILSELISQKLDKSQQWRNLEKRFANFSVSNHSYIIPLATVLAAIGYFAFNQINNKSTFQFNPQVFPVQAVDWIEANPVIEGRMFNEFNWGGYLLYRLWPHHLIFLDSQSDFYGEPLMRDYESMLIAQGNWNDLFNKYQISWTILPIHSPLARALASDSEWTTAYQDSVAVIYYRK